MDHSRDRLEENDIVKEIESSFLEYSMSVIVARALPDLRDGLKPVHRRILYDMLINGLTPDKQHRKSATIVGDVMGKFHPHGDSSIYEAMVHMAQDFSYRYCLVDGHGNFGNIAGSGAAAYRYTEAKLSKISMEMLRDINKETVDFIPNYDESTKEPEVLPSRIPNILVNGTMGIAVGMATNIPPHNLTEVLDGCIAAIDNPDITTDELMQYIKGPDFPTGGIILGNSGIKKAYETGRGTITIRSKAHIEEENGKNIIVVEEVPYGVNTEELKNKVAELVHNKTIDGISDYHTDLKNGLKITITLKKDANPQIVLNNLYKHTDFQVNFGAIFLMLDKGVPKTLGLRDIITKYVDFQKEVIVRRTKYDLKKAEERAHLLEGLKIAIDNIDEVVKIIRGSANDDIAKSELMKKFNLDDIQTQAILDMRLRRLTHMSKDAIESELKDLRIKIDDYKDILAHEERINNILKEEMTEIKNKYGDERKTKIDMTAIDYIEDESLIPNEDIIVNFTHKGYIKRLPSNTYKLQNRGGVGIKSITTNDEDVVKNIISLKSHDNLLFFTNKGKVYRIKGYKIPEYSRQAKGLPIINLLPLEKGEMVNSILSITKENDKKYMIFVTKKGLIKRTSIDEFESIRNNGKKAITLKENDELLNVFLSSGNDEILIGASNGRIVKFNENELRSLGRNAAGVKAIDIDENTNCVSALVVNKGDEIIIITENGYGKRTDVCNFRLTHRGSKGVKGLKITDKNGSIVSIEKVIDKNDLVIITNAGVAIKIKISQVNKMSRVTQGVRLINLKNNRKVVAIALTPEEEEDSNNNLN